jgi:hypothetical protein
MQIADIPKDVIDSILAIGASEYGGTEEQSDEAHVADFATTLRLTREHFGTEGDTSHKSVFIADTSVVIAHTGNSPNSAQHARILSGLWNWMHELAVAHRAQAKEAA